MNAPEDHPRIAPREKLSACIHCGLCLEACPTYVETGLEVESPRGRIHLMKALEEGTLAPDRDVVRHLDLCLGCRACETACPSGVEYGSLIEGARHFVEEHGRRSLRARWKRRLLLRTLPDPARLVSLRRMTNLAARLGAGRVAALRWLPRRLRRMAALLPEPAHDGELPQTVEPKGEARGTVALLTGCVSQVFFPEANRFSAELLARAGYRVRIPPHQACCGALSAHAGDHEQAIRLARKNVNVFQRAGVDWVVTNAAGCGALLRGYDRLLAGDDLYGDAARELAPRVRDVTELLAEGHLPVPTTATKLRVAYHDACHLAHGQGVTAPPRDLLGRIPGIELVEVRDDGLCCGSAGTYNLTEPEMAWRLAARKVEAILATGADTVCAGNPGCILQIRAALRMAGRRVPVLHTVELLARAHGIV